jgi:prepilin-type processing-associated H-X9-DG protein
MGVYGAYPPNTNGPITWWANTTVFNMQVALFLCPSDNRVVKQPITNYMANIGGPFVMFGYSGPFVPTNPALTDNGNGTYTPWNYPQSQNTATVSISGITDGTSNTAMWSEGVSGTNSPVVTGTNKLNEIRGFFASNFSTNWTNLPTITQAPAAYVQRFIATCNNLPPGTLATGVNGTGTRGLSWQISFPYYANYGMYNHVSSPNSRSCSNVATDTVGLDVYGTSPPTSFHPGGVNVGMCDGSVRFIKEVVNLNTWWAVGTRASNEAIDSNKF